jgi:tRNA threonylcarbamoyl adenosine modification protein YeaZ
LKRVLALDTSTWWGGLALVSQEGAGEAPRVIAELGATIQGSHTGHLLPRVEWLLSLAGWSKRDPDAYVATRGPGSFTGIRVGLGTIQGLGVASGRPCIGIDTLEAMAEAHGPADRERLTLITAGRGDLYGARYDPGSCPPKRLAGPWLRPLAELAAAKWGGALLIFAPGSEAEARQAAAGGATVAWPPRSIAAAAGRLALLGGIPDQGDAAPLTPLYLRAPETGGG